MAPLLYLAALGLSTTFAAAPPNCALLHEAQHHLQPPPLPPAAAQHYDKKPLLLPLPLGPPPASEAEQPELRPHYETRHGVAVAWQTPSAGTTPVRGTLLLLHGYGGCPADFWDLPEESGITRAALAHGYAVLAVGREGAFWSKARPAAANRDMCNVVAVVTAWRMEQGLHRLPLAGLGVSDGGTFVSLLAAEARGCLQFAALVIMISRGSEDAFRMGAQAGAYPPTLFIEMPMDKETSWSVRRNVATLQAAGIPTGTVHCGPLRLHDAFFSDRIPGLDPPTSARLLRALRDRRHVDAHGYFVNPSPHSADWRFVRSWDWERLVDALGVLAAPGGGGGGGAATNLKWSRAVAQELSLAFGFHCPTSLKTPQMLHWFNQHVSPLQLLPAALGSR